jgi:hypothetical protein
VTGDEEKSWLCLVKPAARFEGTKMTSASLYMNEKPSCHLGGEKRKANPPESLPVQFWPVRNRPQQFTSMDQIEFFDIQPVQIVVVDLEF